MRFSTIGDDKFSPWIVTLTQLHLSPILYLFISGRCLTVLHIRSIYVTVCFGFRLFNGQHFYVIVCFGFRALFNGSIYMVKIFMLPSVLVLGRCLTVLHIRSKFLCYRLFWF